MSNSSLVNVTKLSPNNSGKRTAKICRITPHCIVGQASVEACLDVFFNTARQASANYIIGTDGRVGLCVDEANRSWCSSSSDNDQQAVTIECASDNFAPYAFNTNVFIKLIDLCVDICKRNNKTKLVYFTEKNTSLTFKPAANEMLITLHRWFAATECPGAWLVDNLPNLVNQVNAKLAPSKIYRVQVGAYKRKAYAENMLKDLTSKGFQGFIVQYGDIYRVQVGAFTDYANAQAMLQTLNNKGYKGFIVEK